MKLETCKQYHLNPLSPSSRRAWIEIEDIKARYRSQYVALLAEGVD